MKNRFRSSAIFFIFLLCSFSSTPSARVLIHGNHRQDQRRLIEDSIRDSMEMENCDEGDEECLERGAVSEPHLDYVYTERYGRP